jgi:SAM-dependent methyltransferase
MLNRGLEAKEFEDERLLMMSQASATYRPELWNIADGKSNMKLNPQELRTISQITLKHYDHDADYFWEGTRNHDVSQNIAALLQHIDGKPPYTILDFGCGPGRDLKVFAELGHVAVGLEGAPRFAVMARTHSGCEVWRQDFLKLDLPANHFDGVFANAAMFHVPSQELPRVLLELCATLKPGGVLFNSNPHGHNEEGWNGGRYGAFYDLETWRRYMLAAGFVELTHYYRPAGLPREQQPWLANVWRRPAC